LEACKDEKTNSPDEVEDLALLVVLETATEYTYRETM
jgi:hypothetical protein